MPRTPILPSPSWVLGPSILPGRGFFPTDSLDAALYSAMIVGGGWVAAHGGCSDDDNMDVDNGDNTVYCSTRPHVWSQMWPENAKNEAHFPLTSCLWVSVGYSHGKLWDGPRSQPEYWRTVKHEVGFSISVKIMIPTPTPSYLVHV